jgi:hypothetical protein
LPHSNFLKKKLGDTQAQFALITSHVMNVKGHITCPVTCYIPLIPIICPKHA